MASVANGRERCIEYKPNNTGTYATIFPKIPLKAQLDKSRKALTRLTPEKPLPKEFAKLRPKGLPPHVENTGLTKGWGTKPLEIRAYFGRFFCQENA